jgi:hypothetical protein
MQFTPPPPLPCLLCTTWTLFPPFHTHPPTPPRATLTTPFPRPPLCCTQAINLRKGSLSAGYSLLLKSGPHWLELAPSALPLTIYSSTTGSSSSSSEAGPVRAETNKAPPVQVLCVCVWW